MTERTYTAFFPFCGLGGGALGFRQSADELRGVAGRFAPVGGIDSDPAACEDFRSLVGEDATCADLFDRESYEAFHGGPPATSWREVGPADVLRAARGEHPDVLFTSPPCKGLSGLLSEAKSTSGKYQALNRLVTRGLFLALEAFRKRPPRFILLENVPRIAQRGRPLLDQVTALLSSYGYAVTESTHNCGELGGLAQNRHRFLLVARHVASTQPFLYEPHRQRVRAIGSVLETMPLPGAPIAGPMHRLPRLKRETWIRLALIPAGRDWRALREIDAGQLRLVTVDGARFNNVYRVARWDEPSPAVTGGAGPSSGGLAVADPRVTFDSEYSQYGVKAWEEPAATVTGQAAPGSGPHSVADPRVAGWGKGKYRVTGYEEPTGAVIGASGTGQGAFAVADPRLNLGAGTHSNVYRVTRFAGPAPTITGAGAPSNGAIVVADPRLACAPRNGTMQVTAWDEAARTVTGSGDVWAGSSAVADPRVGVAEEPLLIIAEDGTWHRPLTTLELAGLQGFPVRMPDGSALVLAGKSHSGWRERIGNAVPPPAAKAIAEVMLRTLLAADAGITFMLGGDVWVHQLGDVEVQP